MTELPNGVWVLAERECELCDKTTSIHDLEWKSVHNHTIWLACPACRRKMDTWKPLPGPSAEDDPDNVRVPVKEKKQKAAGLRQSQQQRQVEEQAAGFTLEFDEDFTLDSIEESE